MPLDWSNARPGQREGAAVVFDRIRLHLSTDDPLIYRKDIGAYDDYRITSVVMPCGYGKRAFAQACSFDLWERGLVACALLISPNEYLREQCAALDKMNDFIQRFRVRSKQGQELRYAEIKRSGIRYNANGEFLLSTTIQLMLQNLDNFAEWVESVTHETGKLVLIWSDETHSLTASNEWGKVLNALLGAGAHICLMTATPYRDDGDLVAGFRFKELSNDPYKYPVTKPGHSPETIIVQLWGASKVRYELEPDFEWSFQQAWRENALCHLNRWTFDVELTGDMLNGDSDSTSKQLLSELKDRDARRVLGKVVRNPLAIRRGAQMFLDYLRQVRRTGSLYARCAGVVYTANDQNDMSNEHAEQIKAALQKIDPSLDIKIATTADDVGSHKNGLAVLKAFVFDGQGDVLIVKQMAGLGMDADRIKVVWDMSPNRTVTGTIQRWNRATRPYQGMLTAHVITPADVLSGGLWHRFIESEGGASRTVDAQLIWEREQEKLPLPPVSILGTKSAGVGDTKGGYAAPERLRRVAQVLERLPILLMTMTIPDIADKADELAAAWGAANEDNITPVNTGDILKDLRDRCNDIAHNLANIRFIQRHQRPYRKGQDSPAYGEIMSGIWTEAYRRAEVTREDGSALGEIRDKDKLARVLAELEEMAARETYGEPAGIL